MRIIFYTLILFSMATFSSCGNKYVASALPEVQLKFGNGGGFTGAESMFILLDNGQVFKQNSLTNSNEALPKLKRRVVKELFAMVNNIPAASWDVDDPGNIYKFIEVQTPSLNKRITWGGDNAEINDSINKLHSLLVGLVNTNSDIK